MKTKLNLIAITLAALPSMALAHPFEAKTLGELAELGLHKLERLTAGSTPHVEKSFQTQVIEVLVGANTNGEFAIDYLQGVASDGTRKTLTIKLIDTGSVTSFAPNLASAPQSPVNFPVLNAVSLLENSMHCVEGELVGSSQACANTPELKLFNEKFKRALMTPINDGAGTTIGAMNEIFGNDLDKKAVITLKADGSLVDQNPIQIIKL